MAYKDREKYLAKKRARYQKHKEEIKAKRREYYQKHKVEEYQRWLKYRENNRDKVNAWKMKDYEKNKEKILNKQKEDYHKRPEFYKEKNRLSHLRNREKRLLRNYQVREEKKLKGIMYLGGKKCSKCNATDLPLCCYDFHHLRDKGGHDNTINSLLTKSWENWGEIKKELDKCTVLCANCHRIIHTKSTQIPRQ